MMRASWLLVCAPVVAVAQEAAPSVRIELRVTAARPRAAVVDRGALDGLAVGDRVTFFPREGGNYEGVVSELTERSATVDLDDPARTPPPGTRAGVRIPTARLQRAGALERQELPEIAIPEHPPWQNQDEEWRPGDALLAKVVPLRPDQRPRSIRTRTWVGADHILSSEDDRTDTFARLGGDVEYENLTGRGDHLRVEAELNWRNTDVPDDFDDDSKTRLRLERLSYGLGGTRFEPTSLEFGRFMQLGVPEFGVLDGFEWGTRTSGGDRFGASIGFMPEPDTERETIEDFQVAAFYRWVRDESETLAATFGVQKSFHDADADRDLLLLKFESLPRDDWTAVATAWVDVYSSGDEAKGSGVELTQAYVDLGRRFEGGSSVHLVFTHLAFPEIERDEFLPVTEDQLADDHNERLALRVNQRLSRTLSARLIAGGWVDEDDDGFDGEVGFDVRDLTWDGSFVDVAAFVSNGRSSDSVGGRATLGTYTAHGRFAFDYELANHRLDGFSADNDDLPQHRARASVEHHWGSGWNLSGYAEGGSWDDQASAAAGFYLTRSF